MLSRLTLEGKIMKIKIVLLIVILTLLLFLNACTPENQPTMPAVPTATVKDIVEGGLFPGSPCSAPCLLGIQPDLTNYDEAIKILSTNHELDSCKEYKPENAGGDVGIQCKNSFYISFDSEKKLVKSLGYDPASNFTVQNVIDQFGDPTNIYLESDYSKAITNTQLFYAKYRMSILLEDQDGEAYTISPNSKVRMVIYDGEKPFQALTIMAQHWSGYGKYTN
jgi:hypothetical protein